MKISNKKIEVDGHYVKLTDSFDFVGFDFIASLIVALWNSEESDTFIFEQPFSFDLDGSFFEHNGPFKWNKIQ